MLPQYMEGVFCNLNIPSSCVQESRPLLATVIRSVSGLVILSPKLTGPMRFADREAVAELWGRWTVATSAVADGDGG